MRDGVAGPRPDRLGRQPRRGAGRRRRCATCSSGPSPARSSSCCRWPTAPTRCVLRTTEALPPRRRPGPRPGRPVGGRAGGGRARRPVLRDLPDLAGPDAPGAAPPARPRAARRARPSTAPRSGSTPSWPAAAWCAASATCRPPGPACPATPSTRCSPSAWPTCRARWPPSPSTTWPSACRRRWSGVIVDFDGGGRYRCEMTDVRRRGAVHRRPGRHDLPARLDGAGRAQLLLEGPPGRRSGSGGGARQDAATGSEET